jgi:hypothetical protein
MLEIWKSGRAGKLREMPRPYVQTAEGRRHFALNLGSGEPSANMGQLATTEKSGPQEGLHT